MRHHALRRIFTKYALVAALGFMLIACGKDVVLLANLTEQDANEVTGLLLSNGMRASKMVVKDGVSVVIKEEDMSNAVAALKAAGLPNKVQTSLGEVFKKEGVISTPLEERARYIYALSQELEFTLSQIDNVILSRVHVVLPERVAPGQPMQPSSAAVFIKHLPELDPDVIEARVRDMVARSIPGLSKQNENKISISFVESEPSYQQLDWQSFGPFIVKASSLSGLKTTIYSTIILSLVSIILAVMMTLARTRVWLVTKIPALSKIAV